jgi:hypothetical protein
VFFENVTNKWKKASEQEIMIYFTKKFSATTIKKVSAKYLA